MSTSSTAFQHSFTPASILATGIALPPPVDSARFMELDQEMRAL